MTDTTQRPVRRTRRAGARTARLAARLSPEQKRIVERAAALRHQPVSQFVVSSAIRAAEQVIHEHDIITLSERDSQAVMEALLHPAPAGPALKRVAERYKTFMSEQ